MIWVDFVILTIISISALMSLFRGLVKETLSLIGFGLAIWAAIKFMPTLAPVLNEHVPLPSARLLIAFAIIFLVTLVCSSIVIFMITKLISATGLSGTDRLLGIFFGIARGVLIVTLLIFLAGYTALPKDPWWTQSMLIKHFDPLVALLSQMIPENLNLMNGKFSK